MAVYRDGKGNPALTPLGCDRPWRGALIYGAVFGVLIWSLLLVAASPASAQYTVLCENSGIGCISFSGYTGQSVWGYPVDQNGNNCTNYAAFRLSQNGMSDPGNLGNAGSWATNAQAKGFTVNQTPTVGSIAQWNYGSEYAEEDGHVAYVEEVGSGYIVETESNYKGPSRRVRITSGDRYWPNNFIHFKDVGGVSSGSGPPRIPLGDWNGDGKTDFTAYYPATGEWHPYLNTSGEHGYEWVTWGGPGWIPVPGDYNGDGRTDYTVYNPATGEWHPYINNPGGEHGGEWVTWGGPGWIPVPGDYNGDGKTDYTIYNPSTGEWRPYINNPSGEHGWPWVTWGGPGEIPVPGDYNGDGKTDYAVYNPATGLWRVYLNTNGEHGYEWVKWGGPGWIPLPYDWNGDGRTDFVIYNPRTGELKPYINNPGGEHGYEWETWGGGPDEVPVVGDWNGDGRADIATYNLASGLWRPYLTNPSGEHGWQWVTWGGGEAIPVVNYDNLLWDRRFFPPTATFTASTEALTVSVNGSASHDAYASEPASWEWSFGDGSTATGAITSHTYAASGTYTVTLTVRDVLGAVASVSQAVTAAGPANNGNDGPGGGETSTGDNGGGPADSGQQSGTPSGSSTVSSGGSVVGVTSSTIQGDIASVLHLAGSQSTIYQLLKTGGYRFAVNLPDAGVLTIQWATTAALTNTRARRGHGHNARRVIVATGSGACNSSGRMTMNMHLTLAGRKQLKTHNALRVIQTATFTPRRGRAQTQRATITIRAKHSRHQG
jgi:hypothetical protein